MQLQVQLSLPRDARYVPVMRNIAESLLGDLDAPAEAIQDIKVALSEACSNVVLHAEGVDTYSIRLAVDARGCEIEVEDMGPGFGERTATSPVRDLEAEAGRGLALIEALVDDLEFDRDDEAMRVRLAKRWDGVGLPPAELDPGVVADRDAATLLAATDHAESPNSLGQEPRGQAPGGQEPGGQEPGGKAAGGPRPGPLAPER